MNSTAKKEQYKNRRRERQSKVRQALLINEYVYTKYWAVYREAAQYYNKLNEEYPTKRDLRKCYEFRKWKCDTNGLGVQAESEDRPVQIKNTRRNTKYHVFCHTNIDLSEQHQLELTVPERPDQSEQQPESPDIDLSEQHQLELTVPESPDQSEQQPESPDIDLSEQHQLELTVPESPDQSEQQPERPEVEKIMQLKIPLLKPSVVTKTLFIQTEETIQENPLEVAAEGIIQETPTFHPSLTEEIPQDIIDKIINELREDPELKTIMTDMEQDLEFEQLGMELDIADDDRLENELENLLW